MEENKYWRDQFKVAVPVRVRGMSSQNRFFDEETETNVVGQQAAVTHLRNLVDLETEIHLTSLKTNVGGTFRVIWINTQAVDGVHTIGLELLDPEGDLWQMNFPAPATEAGEVAPQVWLECQRCHQKLSTPVPEAPGEFLCEGLLLARHCDQCKATTSWGIISEPTPAEAGPEPVQISSEAVEVPKPEEEKAREEQRVKGRAPIKMTVKVIRKKYGTTLEDICQTINVSRTGAYFLTDKNYEVGEPVEVILPFVEGDVSIPVPARIVRRDQPQGTFQKAVAIRLGK